MASREIEHSCRYVYSDSGLALSRFDRIFTSIPYFCLMSLTVKTGLHQKSCLEGPVIVLFDRFFF